MDSYIKIKRALERLRTYFEKVGQEESAEIKELEQKLLPTEVSENVPKKELINKIFSEWGISPVSVSGKPSYFSGGNWVYGNIFRVIYQSKTAIAKVVFQGFVGDSGPDHMTHVSYGDKSRDVTVWKAIMGARNKLRPEVAKHIPEIYVAESGNIDGQQYDLIVMEELKPLNSDLLSAFKGQATNVMMRDLRSPDFLYQLIAKTIAGIQKSIDSRLDNRRFMHHWEAYEVLEHVIKDESLAPELLKNLLQINLGTDPGKSMILIENFMADEIIKRVEPLIGLSTELKQAIRDTVINSIPFIGTPGIPTDPAGIEVENIEEYPPEVRNFMELLLDLKGLGVEWYDLHKGNIMMGQDGNLKMIDVGLYGLKQQ